MEWNGIEIAPLKKESSNILVSAAQGVKSAIFPSLMDNPCVSSLHIE